jgi:hypothetical protein
MVCCYIAYIWGRMRGRRAAGAQTDARPLAVNPRTCLQSRRAGCGSRASPLRQGMATPRMGNMAMHAAAAQLTNATYRRRRGLCCGLQRQRWQAAAPGRRRTRTHPSPLPQGGRLLSVPPLAACRQLAVDPIDPGYPGSSRLKVGGGGLRAAPGPGRRRGRGAEAHGRAPSGLLVRCTAWAVRRASRSEAGAQGRCLPAAAACRSRWNLERRTWPAAFVALGPSQVPAPLISTAGTCCTPPAHKPSTNGPHSPLAVRPWRAADSAAPDLLACLPACLPACSHQPPCRMLRSLG